MPEINTGLGADARETVCAALAATLADTYVLYTKTHRFHWNVTGPQFHTLHTLFEEHYTDMWAAIDEVAERIRALGQFVLSHKEMTDISVVDNTQTGDLPAEDMVRSALSGHEALICRARQSLEAIESAGDAGSADLVTVRIQVHEKNAWMLRSML